MSLIRSVSGLRGIVGNSFNPEIIIKYINSFAQILPKGKIIVGRDPRKTGLLFNKVVISTLAASGRDVIDLGIVPTPTVLINVSLLKAAGGVIITASHNPEKWNALKLVNSNGNFIDKKTADRLFKKVDENSFDWVKFNCFGSIFFDDKAIERHKNILKKSNFYKKTKKRKICLDMAGGASAVILPQICEDLNCDIKEIIGGNTDGNFTRSLEPTPENLKDLSNSVKKNRNSIGFATDTDGDRLAMVDEDGVPIGEEKTLQIATQAVLEEEKGTVVANLSTSSAVKIIAQKENCKFYYSKVGEANVVHKMKKVNAIIGGEGNGGVIFPEIYPARDAQTAVVLVLYYLEKHNITLKEAVKKLPKRFMIKEKISIGSNIDSNLDFDRFDNIINKGKKILIDGLKVENNKSWFHIRKSGTEPIIRIIAESSDKEDSVIIINNIKAIIYKK